MLIIEHLKVSYKPEKEVLKGINMSLSSGYIDGLAGLNGAGKTTLLNTIFQFINPQQGAVLYKGEALKRKDISYLETDNYFYPNMTGYEYLELFPGNTKKADYESWGGLFSLPLKEVIESYSTGMKKKLALLAILKQNKPIMILDEPFNGLDLDSVQLLNLILEKLRSPERIILITSHIFETLTNCCDRIHYLKEGVIQQSYSKEEFKLLENELNTTIRERWETVAPSGFSF